MLTAAAATMRDPKVKHAEMPRTRETSLLMQAQQPSRNSCPAPPRRPAAAPSYPACAAVVVEMKFLL